MLMIRNKIVIMLLFFFTCFAQAETSQTKELDKLFIKLSKIDNSEEAKILEKEIWALWNKHPNDNNLTNKLELGTELMYGGDYQYALQVFNNIIKTDPFWPEAGNKRATLLFFMKDYPKSLSDIDKVLSIEPRHFGALSGRAQIFIQMEEYYKAIIDLKRAKKINPVIIGNNLILELEKIIKGVQI